MFVPFRRSTGSSAICRYKFSDMTNVFQTSKYCSSKMGVSDCETLTDGKNPSVNVAKMKVKVLCFIEEYFKGSLPPSELK